MFTRKKFLLVVALGAMLMHGCGGDDEDTVPDLRCGASGAEIGNNHGHALAIPATDLRATSDKTYTMVGTAGHDHTVRVTPMHMEVLRAGGTVTVLSSNEFAHVHSLTIGCSA